MSKCIKCNYSFDVKDWKEGSIGGFVDVNTSTKVHVKFYNQIECNGKK